MTGPAWDLYAPLVHGLIEFFLPVCVALLGVNYLERGARASVGGGDGVD